MIDIVSTLIAFTSGVFLGFFYFGGLWWTVRKLGITEYPSSVFLLSVLFRTSIVTLGFYFILGDNWLHLVAGLLGFMCVRILSTRYVQQIEKFNAVKQETDYAP